MEILNILPALRISVQTHRDAGYIEVIYTCILYLLDMRSLDAIWCIALDPTCQAANVAYVLACGWH